MTEWKALSIRQPWPWFILHKGKTHENRTWNTKHRGWFLLHASGTIDTVAYNWFKSRVWMPARRDLRTGGIVGMAYLHSVETQSKSPWFEGPYGFRLIDARRLPFYPCRGQLNFWTPDIPDEYKIVIEKTRKARWI